MGFRLLEFVSCLLFFCTKECQCKTNELNYEQG